MSGSLSEVLRSVLPLAVGAAVSPVILLLQMVVLTDGEARLRRAGAVAAGAATSLIAWGVAGWLLIDRLPTPRRGPDATAAAVDLVLALVLVALGLRALTQRHDPAPTPSPGTSRRASSVGVAYGLGVAAMAGNVTTIVLFLPAVRDIARADLAVADTAVALAVLLAITLAPALLPVLAVSIGGAGGRRALDRLGAFTSAHHATIAAVVSFGFALYLGLKGLRRL